MPSPYDTGFPRLNQEGKIVGFGLLDETKVSQPAPNSFLKTVYLSVGNQEECVQKYNALDTARNFCGRDDNPDAMNVCKGDLGSAFVVSQRGIKILVCKIFFFLLSNNK